MGYCIQKRTSQIYIPAASVEAAKAAVQKSGRYSRFRFVYGADVDQRSADPDSVVDLAYMGEKMGWGEDVELLTLAPFLRMGDYLEFVGEDGLVFRYVVVEPFPSKRGIQTQWAKIVYDPQDPTTISQTLSE